jgi:hypothetical protein
VDGVEEEHVSREATSDEINKEQELVDAQTEDYGEEDHRSDIREVYLEL